jgi:hypothetical protein
MPGIAAAPPPSGVVGDPAVDYANAVAKAIGFDPRVAYAWQKAEGDPGDLPGYYNYMNIKTTTAQSLGIPVVGTGPAGTAKFANVTVGEQAAIAEIRSKAIGITNERGKSIAQQISDIAASPWASSHYGGPGGPNLLRDFQSMYPGVDTGSSSQQPLPAAGGGQSQGQTGAPIPNPIAPITDALNSVTDAFKFLFSYRFLEILGGGVLILAGLYVLARQFQQTFPDPLGLGKRAVANETQERVVVREQRAAETHTARVKQTQARTTEIRSRSRARTTSARLTKEAARREYNRGALDQATAEASPTMTKIRRQRG